MKLRVIDKLILLSIAFTLTFNASFAFNKINNSQDYDVDPDYTGKSQYDDSDYDDIDDDYDADFSVEHSKSPTGETPQNTNVFDYPYRNLKHQNPELQNPLPDDPKVAIEYKISLPWVQDILNKDCKDGKQCNRGVG